MTAIISLLICTTSCNHFLGETPDNRVDLNTIEKSAQLLTNGYSNAGYTFTEWMSDNVSNISGTDKRLEHTQAYTWTESTGSDQDTPSNFWTSTYDGIAHANEVLAVIDNLPGDEARKNAVKGEALMIRAYGHFMLVNLFAKHYSAKTASKDLGIPYIEQPETEFVKKYNRNTVKEVYDKIERDIIDGLELVDGSFYANSGKYHFTKNAALALASRFYLFKGEPDNCIKYSSALLGGDAANFVKDIPNILKVKVSDDDYARLYSSPDDNSNLLLMRQVTNFFLPYKGYWPSTELYKAIFESNPYNLDDEREFPAWVAGTRGVEAGSAGLAASKYQFLFERTSITSEVGFNYTIFFAFRGEEVLLNRAESYLFQGDINAALTDLQFLASKRYQPNKNGTKAVVNIEKLRSYYGLNNDDDVVLNYIIDERRKEFMHEGLRWFDLKRYQISVNHAIGNNTITLKGKDNRKVLQIPQAAIDVGGLEPNPK